MHCVTFCRSPSLFGVRVASGPLSHKPTHKFP